MIDVRPKVFFHFAAPWRFQIHNPVHARIDVRNVVRTAGLEKNGVPGVRQHRHQQQNIFLQKRLAAGDLNQRTIEATDKIDNRIQCLLFPFVERVFRVAIIAAQIAKSQPDESTALSRPRALPLDRLVNLVNRQCLLGLVHFNVER